MVETTPGVDPRKTRRVTNAHGSQSPVAARRAQEPDEAAFTCAGAVLADWGADVIKVEHAVTGDAQRNPRLKEEDREEELLDARRTTLIGPCFWSSR